jgi:2-polyprenyl-3-methyl-5-hydroxy-6-metoxy-1,4-benzoquinol methylase
MDDTTKIIRDYYNESVLGEWNRIDGRPEFLITCNFIDRYIKSGDKVLDIGGGPGRYSLYLAEKGCDVTLFDLSEENVKFASERGIKAISGDARTVDGHFTEQFDHILLMGPMYHLLQESERVKAVNSALKLLKSGGKIFISFISLCGGLIYGIKIAPETIIDEAEIEFYKTLINNESFTGQAFTQAFFINQREVLPFMEQFPLTKLHFFGQEGITSPCESNIMSQPKEIVDAWIDFATKLSEREEFLSWSEHLMYIGEKIN